MLPVVLHSLHPTVKGTDGPSPAGKENVELTSSWDRSRVIDVSVGSAIGTKVLPVRGGNVVAVVDATARGCFLPWRRNECSSIECPNSMAKDCNASSQAVSEVLKVIRFSSSE